MRLFIAAVAASASLTVHADDPVVRNWIGGEEGVANTPESPYTIQNLANWDGSGTIGYGYHNNLYLSVAERTYINSTQGDTDRKRLGDYFCPNSGEFVFTGPLWNLGLFAGNVADSTVSIVKKSGDWTFQNYVVQFGVATSSTVVFTNESGNVNSTGDTALNKIGAGAGSYAKVVNQSGDWTFNGKLILADKTGSTGIVENVSGDWSVGGDLDVASVGYGEFTQYGGSLTVGGDMYISHYSSGRGVLTIKGGTVTVPSDKSVRLQNGTTDPANAINLDGGTLVTPTISRGGGNLDLNFNGGTLKANASANLLADANFRMVVHVNAGGGVIDCGGYAVTLKSKIGSSGDTGSLTFTGGNIITIDNEVLYSGATRVTPGTILAISNATAKANILGTHGLVVAGVPTAGQTIVTYNDTLTVDDYANISCPLRPDTTYKIGDDGMSIVVDNVSGSPDGNYWTGAVDNDLSNIANWSNNEVPTENAVIYSVTNATLTKGEGFAPKSITFLAGSAAVTIDGDFTTLTSITNNSTLNQTFAGAVDFGEGDIDVTQTGTYTYTCTTNNTYNTITEYPSGVSGGCVVFKGGVKGNDIVNHKVLSGHYELTKTSDFDSKEETDGRIVINDNSSLSVKRTGNTRTLYIREGATFNVENSTPTPGSNGNEYQNCLWFWSKGTYVVSNLTHTAPATPTSRECWLGGHTFNAAYGDANANAVLKIGSLTIDCGKYLALHGTGVNSGYSKTAIFIGEGGVNIASGKAGYYRVTSKIHKTTLRPWNSDFTFGRGSTKDYDFILGEGANEGNIGDINFTLNTDDEAGIPRTITMDARIKTTKDTSSITVAGHGTNVVTSASPLMTGTYAVTDAATVKFTAGAGFANDTSRISLDDGTTLEYSNVGNTLALPCKTLVLPSSGKATLRINGNERLRSGDHTLVSGVTAGAENLLDVELADGVKVGRNYEVAVKDGNLVLHVIPSSGVMLIVF